MVNNDIVIVLIIVVATFVTSRWVERQLGHRIGEPDVLHYEEKIAALQEELQAQKQRYEQKIKELEKRVDFLVDQLLRAGIHIADLEKAVATPKTAQPEKEPLSKPLLLVCGDDSSITTLDRQSLRRAGISFHRLLSATKRSIEDELRRRRQDGSLYIWLHVAAHADDSGIALSDGYAPPAWWNEQLDGLQVVFLAACKTSKVADALAGLVTVVFVQEEIESQDAADFTYAFWKRMKEHGNPTRAYRQAVEEVPQVSEFTDIRTK